MSKPTRPITIDKGIPVPDGSLGRNAKYPWATMEVGDSFLFPETISQASALTQAWRQSKDRNRNFVVRRTESGSRCWRTK